MWLRVNSIYLYCFLSMSLILNHIANAQRAGNVNNGYGNQQNTYKYPQKQQIQNFEYTNQYEEPKKNYRHFQQKNELPDDEEEVYGFGIDNTEKEGHDIRQHRRQKQQTAKIQSHAKMISDEQNAHKCRIWVPIEAAGKYKGARDVGAKDEANQLTTIELCCKGFEPIRWRANTICHPYCENCRNGFCVAPNSCECYPGFVKNDNDDCVFTCPLGCLNGRCYLDGTCQCDPGYKLDETRKYCRPICSAGCDVSVGQNCTEPEVCGCAKGFQLKTNGCERVCDPDCGIGGKCDENNECQCHAGYSLKENVCQSECYQSCENGICMSQNRCICNPNYQYHERSTMCIPV